MSGILTDQSLKLPLERLSALFAERGAMAPPDILGHWGDIGVPTSPSARLSRKQTAETLKKAGYPTRTSTLNSLATLGVGPPFVRFGPYAVYEWGDALAWAQARESKKGRSSSEGRSQESAERARKSAKIARDIRDAKRAKAKAEAVEARRRAGAKTRGATAEHRSTAAE